METQNILYETLSPLDANATTADTPPPPPTSSSSEFEPYIVLRNHISLSNVQCPSPESVAPDYFSLEVNDAGDKETSILRTPPQAAETSTPAAERTLEGNWFRANSRFKSPMLRLHKGFKLLASLIYSNEKNLSNLYKFLSNLYKFFELDFCLISV